MKNDTDTAHTPKELRNERRTIVAEAEALMGSPAEPFSNLRERFGAAQEHLADTCEGAKKQIVAGAKYADTSIRQKPYQSVAIALGVGVLVGVAGLLIGRRGE